MVKSVNANYEDEIQFVKAAKLEVRYKPTRAERNGIDAVSQMQSCTRLGGGGGGGTKLRCREKLTNMDQVICAYAYDNSRKTYGRWVGKTDPNGDDLQV
jgi:hypothetical protein